MTHLRMPRKRFSQHFLHDENVINQIIDIIQPLPNQTLVEIGPGQGALTRHLSGIAAAIHVIEIDRDLCGFLQELFSADKTLAIHCMDALDFNFQKQGLTNTRIIGNLPYNVSTPLLFHLLGQLEHIKDMIFMLQEEVVDRLQAEPGNKVYGRLSVMVQSQCQVDKLMRIEPAAFNPIPRVNSGIVRLVPRTDREKNREILQVFTTLVRESFNHRRKTLHNCLKHLMSDDAIRNAGIEPGTRAEQLSVAQFLALSQSAMEQPWKGQK